MCAQCVLRLLSSEDILNDELLTNIAAGRATRNNNNRNNNNNNNNNNATRSSRSNNSSSKQKEECGFFNSFNGCKKTADTCTKKHICSLCQKADHGKTKCAKFEKTKNWRCQLEQDAMIIESQINNLLDSDSVGDSSNVGNDIDIENNKKYLFNTPPLSYCATYSSLTQFLNADEDYPLHELLQAAQTKDAVCPVTNFTIATAFKPLAWALRLAATRYPYPAAAVTLVKCLRVGVDLGFYGQRNRIQLGPNLESAYEHPDAIDKNIATELDNGRRKGPFTEIPFDNEF